MVEKYTKSQQARLYKVEAIATYLEQGVPIITPNQRLASRIKNAWNYQRGDSGVKSWRTADVSAIENWFHASWQKYTFGSPRDHCKKLILDQYAIQQLWCTCIKNSTRGQALLKISATAKQAGNAYKNIKLWRLDMTSDVVRQQFAMDDDSTEFFRWFEEFERLCNVQGCLTPEQCIELMLEDPLSQKFDELVLVEFEDIPPLYRDYFEAKVNQFNEYHDNERQAHTFAVACNTDEDEIYAGANWAKQILSREPNATIGFIHPNLTQQRDRVERIFTEVLDPGAIAVAEPRYIAPFNFSAGVQLSKCPPIKVAVEMLKLTLPEVEVEGAVSVLSSRYSKNDTDDLNGRSVIIKTLYDGGFSTLSGSSLRYILQHTKWVDNDQEHLGISLGDKFLSYAETQKRGEEQLPSLWGLRVIAVLEQLGWPGAESLDSVEYQQIENFYSVLGRLENLDKLSGKFDFLKFLNLLQQLLSETIFQSKTPDSQIQILGLLEGAGLQFSHLWIAEMGHLDWPPTAHPNPFLPIGIQKNMSMPHADADREYHYSSQLINRFSHSADYLYFSYVNLRDGITQKLSGMLSHAKTVSVDQLFDTLLDRPYLSLWKKLETVIQFEDYVDISGPSVSIGESIRGGSSLLEDQSACPFRAFAKYRLGAEALGKLESALTPVDRGILMHDALYRFWGATENSKNLSETGDSKLSCEIESIVKLAIDGFLKTRRFQIGERYLQIEKNRLVSLLEEWIELERQREEFIVVAREKEVEFELGPLKISLRIDRIDEVSDGGKLLIDYKSGSCEVKHWFGERLEKPQLPLYAFVEDNVGAIAYGYVKADKVSFVGISGNSSFSEILQCDDHAILQKRKLDWQGDWRELKDVWERQITSLAQEFIDGNASVNPNFGSQTCRYCDIAALCRKHEVL